MYRNKDNICGVFVCVCCLFSLMEIGVNRGYEILRSRTTFGEQYTEKTT